MLIDDLADFRLDGWPIAKVPAKRARVNVADPERIEEYKRRVEAGLPIFDDPQQQHDIDESGGE